MFLESKTSDHVTNIEFDDFSYSDMRINVFPKFIEICMETPCWCPSRWHQHGGRKPAETTVTVTEFWHKSVNLSLEELKNVVIILYSNTRTVQIAKFPEISHILNQHYSSLGRHVNVGSRKSLEIQA